MLNMKHQNILETKDSFFYKEAGLMITVSEFCQCKYAFVAVISLYFLVGSLSRIVSHVRSDGSVFSERFILTVIAQVAQALVYAHS